MLGCVIQWQAISMGNDISKLLQYRKFYEKGQVKIIKTKNYTNIQIKINYFNEVNKRRAF